MDKTVVTFDKDMTSIVGPNGCGKSNVVDAIRWVMGEQSAKHLRGKNMEDVIFAGSENRAPLSMASVELTFSTEGYQTPAAYLNHSEISICRRLYRTGDSEYLINKTPVRLKDITELFLGTGIGTKAYSVIEQGRVGQIITAKSEERRYFIEEVAGISKFKSRKESALRKMEATEQNLTRLNDVLTELERQKRSLDRQAKKAEKYKEVKKEFTHWDLALSSTEYAKASEEQSRLEKDLGERSETEAGIKAKLQNEENQIETSRFSLLEKEKDLNKVQNNLFELTNTIRLTEANVQYKKEEKSKLPIQSLQSEINEVRNEIQGLLNGLDQVNEQRLWAECEEKAYEEEVTEISQKAELSQSSLEELQQSLSALKEEIHQSQTRLRQIETLKANLEHKDDDLLQRLRLNEDSLAKNKSRHQELEKIYKDTSSSLSELKQLKFDLSEKAEGLESELGKLKSKIEEEEVSLAELKEELTLRQSRLTSLEELQKNFEGYQEGTRSVLLKKEEISNDNNIFGTVADYVETQPEYEDAVSAVLGEKLQYVVVKSQSEGMQAIDYLNTQASGRSSFIPMNVRSYSEESGTVAAQEGVLGPLQNFVKLKDYDELSTFLFGDVVVVENLKKALDVWSSNGHRNKLVTLKGEVVDSSGVITGGSAESTSKALLEKKREMKELSELIHELKTKVMQKDHDCQALKKNLGRLSKELEEMKNSSFEEEIKITNQEKDVSHFKKEMEDLQKAEQELSKKIQEEKESLTKVHEEQSALQKEEIELIESLSLKEKDYELKKEHVSNSQNDAQDHNTTLTEAKIKLAQSKERRDYLDHEIQRLQSDSFSKRIYQSEIEIQLAEAEFRQDYLEKEIKHLEKVLSKKIEKSASIEKELRDLREAYDTLSSSNREREVQLKDLRVEQEEASKSLSEISIALTEVRANLKNLIEQCFERHQQSLDEIYKEHLDFSLNIDEARSKVRTLRIELGKIGDVNPAALEEFEEITERFEFLTKQKEDLESSLDSLNKVIQKINKTTQERFKTTFDMVNERFQKVFPQMFNGGRAKLLLTNEDNILETGVDIIAQPPGKRLQSMSLLSGGEKALTAVSLIFAIFQIKPSPFCILDEVDAPLDDANVNRYNETLRQMTNKTQFIVITHNKKTMEAADVLYGVTMQEPGVSQLVSVDLK